MQPASNHTLQTFFQTRTVVPFLTWSSVAASQLNYLEIHLHGCIIITYCWVPTQLYQGCHEFVTTKFHGFSMIFQWPYHKIPWPVTQHTNQLDFDKLPHSGANSWELGFFFNKFHDFSLKFQNPMPFPWPFPILVKIPWLFQKFQKVCNLWLLSFTLLKPN